MCEVVGHGNEIAKVLPLCVRLVGLITIVCKVGWGGFIMSGARMYGFNPKEVEHKISATIERCPDKSIWTFQCLCTKVFTIVNTDPNAKIMGYYCTRCRRPLIVTAGFDVDPNSKFRD